MSEIVRGENVNVTFWDGDNFLGFSCVRSVTINKLTEIVGKSTIGSGKWKEKEKVAWDWNIALEGAMYLSKPGFVGPAQMINYWLSEDPVNVTLSIVSNDGVEIDMWGSVLITNVSENGTVNNAGSMNITGEGTGALSSSTSFRICGAETTFSGTTLTFCFDPVDGATAYTIQIRDITADTTTNDTAGEAPRNWNVLNDHEYAFSLKWEPDGTFGPEIFWSLS